VPTFTILPFFMMIISSAKEAYLMACVGKTIVFPDRYDKKV